jgi:signal transduction histidine kinase
LGNAVKFVEPGLAPRVRIKAKIVPEGMVQISFEDFGIGIRKEAQERVFMMFQRLNPPGRYEGTGIGLTIVRKAVERMGGRVGLESEPGKGSKFWVQLKQAAEA